MQPRVVSVGPLVTANASNIAQSQTPTSGTALTLNGTLVAGGVAVMDTPRRGLLTPGSEASPRTLIVTGADRYGQVQSETLAIPATTTTPVQTVLDYATITKLLPAGGGWTAAATFGTSGVASSQWVYFDGYAMPQVGIQVNVSGTVSVTVQQTLDDPLSPTNPVSVANMTWLSHPDSALVASAVAVQGNYAYLPQWARLTLNSGSGSSTGTFIQAHSVS